MAGTPTATSSVGESSPAAGISSSALSSGPKAAAGNGGGGGGTTGGGGGGGGGDGQGGTSRPRAGGGTYRGEVGVTKDTVTIGFLFAKSGPYQAIVGNVGPAIQAAFDEINAAGGIHGRKLIAITGDDGYNDASTALSSTKAMKDQVFGVSSFVIDTFSAVYSYLDENRIPYLFANSSNRSAALKLRYGFTTTSFLETQAELLPQFMIAKFNARSKKIGVIYQDSPFVRPVVEAFKRNAASAGMRVVVTQPVAETPSTCINEVSKVQASGAEVVWLAGGPLPAACVLRDADNAGYHPAWTGVSKTFDFNVTNTASGCKTDGIVTMGAWQTLESPDGRRYAAAMASKYPENANAGTDDIGYWGWAVAHDWAEALRRAGPGPTRGSFVTGMETMRNWDGGSSAPLTFGPGDRIGSRAVLTTKAVNCQWQTIDRKWRDHF